MEEGRRSGDPSGFIVKNRSSSGCLIVRKKGGDGVGSCGSHKVFESKKEKKRLRMDFSDSGSSDELLIPPRRRVGPETISACNGLSIFDKGIAEESDIGRKRTRGEDVRRNEVGLIGRNGEDLSERKRNKLDVFEFNEYNGNDGEIMRRKRFDEGGMEGRRFYGSMMAGRNGSRREYEAGSSRNAVVERRKSSYFERKSGLGQGDHIDRDVARSSISYLRDNYDSDEPIRVQGKNGVLKVMVNKKKKAGGSLNGYDRLEAEENRKGLRTDDTVKRNVLIHPSFYSESKSVEKAAPLAGTEKNPKNLMKSSSAKKSKVSNRDSQDSETFLKLGPKNVEVRNLMKKPSSTKSSDDCNMDSGDNDTPLKLGRKNVEACKSTKGASSGGEKTPCNQLPATGAKEGKVKRGTGTEKQKLREQIRGMLLNAGWTIDYRPRRNRDYLDAVYINPTGTAYWSIIKAYDALLKQLNDDEDEAKSKGDTSPFMPLSDEVLSQLTRKTRKKIEKEMKKRQRDGNENENARETTARKSSHIWHDEDSLDSDSHEEKLSSFIKQVGKPLKGRTNGSSSVGVNAKGQSSTHQLLDNVEKPSSGSNSHQARKSRKLGRCTLLIRNANEGLNSESDGFVPYAGKRTLLSWLIDCGTVQLSQKVRYMNRRQTKVMLEGWVTRDGIHCGCCSKILTVSKFEIHAGSKLRQPFQNIYVDSGMSLLDCQIDAWNRQESIEHIGFHSVDIDGDDPNDDTCGLCGDGGDLICCDSCPSTFHQSCLDIKMLPPGDWHCPNCTCKFCGIANETIIQGDDKTISMLLTCISCAKQYHKSCLQEKDSLSFDANSSVPGFCGKNCRELFEQLQKYLGVKHELEAGFSWSLIHRTDADSSTFLQGLPHRVECNSKLAVASTVMDECFLPIIDRRSGINLIHNVVYNCGSNFNRLNYNGFYAAILERGDEIISAASIRFHGTQLAEMPFIGTRHIYRRQGMCRRLFCAIESALRSLKVEKLIIPAISELMHTWTEVFGFTTLDESLKQELKSMNMLVFPGIDMLQKNLLEQEHVDRSRITCTGTKQMEFNDCQRIKSEVANRTDMVSSAQHVHRECDNGGLEPATETNAVATANSDCQHQIVSLNDTVMSRSIDRTHELKISVSFKDTAHADFVSGAKLDESALDKKNLCVSNLSDNSIEMDNKSESESESPAEDETESSIQGGISKGISDSQCPVTSIENASAMSVSLNCSHELKNPVALGETTCADTEPESKLPESDSGRKCLICSDMNADRHEESKPRIFSSKEGNINAHELNLKESASDELKVSMLAEETKCAATQSEDMLTKLASKGKLLNSDASDYTLQTETKPVLDSIVEEDNTHSCDDGDFGDANTVNDDMAYPEALPSTEKIIAENSAEINHSPDASASRFTDANESSTQSNTESNDEIV